MPWAMPAPSSSLQFNDAAGKLLAHEIGTANTSTEVAERSVAAVRKLSTHFGRLVGDVAIRALFERSLTVAASAFPWLGEAQRVPRGPSSELWAPFQACLEQRTPQEITEATVLLVADNIGLFVRFIGEELAVGLLHELWPQIFPNPSSEETSS